MSLSPQAQRVLRNGLAPCAGLLAVLVAQCLLFGMLSNRFLTMQTAASILNQIPDLTVVATGMTLVLITGGIDLSVGSLLALSAAVLGVAMVDWQWSVWLAAGLCLLTGLAGGLVNGAIVVRAGLPAFIVTLGSLELARGAAWLLTDSSTKYIGAAIEPIGVPLPAIGLSPAVLVALSVVAAGQIVLSLTVPGRYCLVVGASEKTAWHTGIDPRRPRLAVFALSGLLSALAGIFQTARLASVDPNAGTGLELSAIAAAVIGGTSLMGGRGSVVRTFFGVLIIASLQSGLASIGTSDPVKRLVTGAVIISAVLLDSWRRRSAENRAVRDRAADATDPGATHPAEPVRHG